MVCDLVEVWRMGVGSGLLPSLASDAASQLVNDAASHQHAC